ncbi:MAG: four helix bundle protein [Saprospiraceae bacterium]
MKKIKRLEDIECWQLARDLAKEVWLELKRGTLAKNYALKDQMDRSSGSIMDNIAEGYGRGGNREFVNFLSIARGSSEELKSQICRCVDREHLTKERGGELYKKTITVCVKITNFMTSLNGSKYKGQKFNR